MFLATDSIFLVVDTSMHHDALIEAILFYRGEPVSSRELTELLDSSEHGLNEALTALRERLALGSGLALLENDGMIQLVTSPDVASFLEKVAREEHSREISASALETLAIVIYQGPIPKSQIDYIRGVNTASTLRNLLVRGLLERVRQVDSVRGILYQPTCELLRFLGITRLEELPDYRAVREKLSGITTEIGDTVAPSLETTDLEIVDENELHDRDWEPTGK